MKKCNICGTGINGQGRYRYCLSCGELVRSLNCEHTNKGYKWAVEEAKQIVEKRKMAEKYEQSNY